MEAIKKMQPGGTVNFDGWVKITMVHAESGSVI